MRKEDVLLNTVLSLIVGVSAVIFYERFKLNEEILVLITDLKII